MSNFEKLSDTIYECKYHIVFCSKYRYGIFEGQIGEYEKHQGRILGQEKMYLIRLMSTPV